MTSDMDFSDSGTISGRDGGERRTPEYEVRGLFRNHDHGSVCITADDRGENGGIGYAQALETDDPQLRIYYSVRDPCPFGKY